MTGWLITGGCGFIGTSLIGYLRKNTNDRIRVVDNLTIGTKENLSRITDFQEVKIEDIEYEQLSKSVQLIVGDIRDENLALAATKNIDIIVHLAANSGVIPSIENPRLDCITNVIGTLNYLEGARINQVQRFIFASSGGTVIGNCEPPIHEEMMPHPVAPYGASKSAGEGYCSAYFNTFGVQTIALRFGNVYGIGSNHKNSVVAKFFRRAIAGEVLEIHGDGVQTRDFIYLDDLIDAIVKAATTPNVGGEIFQIATSSETSINELAEKVIEVLKKRNIDAKSKYANPLSGEVRRNFADTSKAKEKLDWQARTSLEKGLLETLDWFLEQQ